MSYPTLFFGVELEFNVAYLYPDQILDTSDPRVAQLKPADEDATIATGPFVNAPLTLDQAFNHSDDYFRDFRPTVMTITIRNSIIKALTAAGLPIDQDPYSKTTISNWGLEYDDSIRQPRDDRYEWCGVEIVSPAYEFNAENLLIVQKVCNILITNYLTETNESTGFHVHVSFGLDKMWEFRSLKNLFMFLWAFEPQFDSLHPANRQMKEHEPMQYAKSMRASSVLALEFWDEFQKEITPLQGLVKLERFKEGQMPQMLRAVVGEGTDRYMAYNVTNIIDLIENDNSTGMAKPTVEFRQAEGTLDGETVTQWVKLLCGTVKFLETAQPSTITDLLKLTMEEHYIKTGDEYQDAQNERQFGKIPAEGNFSIINLLERIGLQESADFYRTRTYSVEGQPIQQPVAQYKWKHEESRSVLSEIDRPIQARSQALKAIWEEMNMIDRFSKPAGWMWDPDHDMWPAHEKIEDGKRFSGKSWETSSVTKSSVGKLGQGNSSDDLDYESQD